MPPSKAAAGRKGYRNKSHSLEVVVRDKINTLSKLQAEAVFLKQKGAVLELLLEVSSEVAVHKRTHTGAKFPELHDTQLLEFLEHFLDSYGGFAADRPTAHNYFQLERLDVEQFKDVRRQDFLEKYTSLVQRLSLLLLQATDNSMKGGLTTTIDDLKQLLLGTLLWSPLTFMQVGTHHLVNGEPLQPDPEHSTKTVSGIDLGPEQEDVLAIIAELYNSQVASMEAHHISLCQVLDAELAQPGSSSGGVAATIMRVSSNMHRMLAIHQLFHVAIMHNLADQQLAHLCVRCFPRFPCMQDLLNALVRMRDQRAKGGLDPPDAPGTTIAATTRDLSSYGHIGLAAGAAPGEPRKPLQKPVVLDASVLSKGRLAEAGSKLLRSSSGLLTSSGVSIKEEGRSTGGAGEADQGSDAAAGAVLEQGVARSPQPADAGGDDVTRRPLKEWDVLGNADAGSLTPSRPESTGAAGGGPGSSHKRARSPASAAAASSSRIGSSGSKAAKRLGLAGPPAAPAATTYSSGSAQQQQQQPGRKAGKPDDRWPRQQQGAAGRNPASSDGMDVSLAVVAAAAAAGMPVDPAAAAALPVPLEQLPAQPTANTSSAAQQQGSLLPPQAIQQLAAVLNSAGGPADMMQLLSSQPKLALLLQQQPQLLGQLQEAMAAQQQQSHHQQQGPALPDLLQAVAAGSAAAAAAGMSSQGLQQGYPAPHRSLSDASAAQQQGRHWDAAAQGAAGPPTSMPALEMLPPSLMAKDPGAGASPLQTLLHSVATLLQACSSVTEAATAAIDGGQGEFVTSAVSAAEAALTTALKGLQDIKGRCHRGASSAGAAGAARAAATAALAGPAGGAGQLGLPPAGPSASRLQPPAGIPMPDPAHPSQAVLPQSLSLALSGTHTTAEPPPHSNSALLAGMGLSHGAANQAASQGPGAAGRAGQRQQQGYAASVAAAAAAVASGPGGDVGPSGTTSRAPGGSSTNDQRAQQQQQQPSFGALLQQLSSTLTEHPAAVGQLAQILQQQGQQLTPEVSAVLAKLVGAASAGGTASDLASIVALLQPKQEQPDSSQQGRGSAWGAGHHHASASPGFDPAGGRAPMGVSQGLPASSRGPAAFTSQAAPAGAVPVSSGAPATALGAGGAAVGGGPGQVKEDSPSAGSSTTNTGQSRRQPGSQDPPAAAAALPPAASTAAEIAAQHAAALGIDPQQLEGIARAAAAALAGQQGPGQAEALVSSMMQFLQQKGPGGAGGGVGSVASMLQAMMSSAGVGPGSLQPKQAAVPAASKPAASAGNARSMAQSAAAAATMIPPAAAAAMAAKQAAAAAAAAGSNSGRRQAVADFGDMEADAASALEMLAAAAVGSQQAGRPQGKRDW